MKSPGCPLCDSAGGHLVFSCDEYRVVRAQEKGFPAFYRLVWNGHVREFSQLGDAQRAACMDAVVAIERVLLQHLQPTKVNLATLGNAVPHLHWHVIARFDWDSHFPGAVWAAAQREPAAERLAHVESLLPEVDKAMQAALSPGR